MRLGGVEREGEEVEEEEKMDPLVKPEDDGIFFEDDSVWGRVTVFGGG